MSTILVTGGAGFIGSHLCEALVARGDRIIAVDNFDPFYLEAIKRRNIAGLLEGERFSLIEEDIRDGATVECILRENAVEAVIHLAARAGVRPSIQDPLLYEDVNVRGTLQILEAMRRAGVARMVFGSSSSVYGGRKEIPFRECDPVERPVSPYAATKRSGELIAYTYHHLFGMNITCLRFFTVYGPRQRPEMAIHKFARRILRGEPIPVFGDGSSGRDYTYVDDIVQGVIAALDHEDGYAIYNLGESQVTTLAELVALLEEATGEAAIVDRRPFAPGDVPITCADVSLAEERLGYRRTTPIREGIVKFIAWLRDEMAHAGEV